MEIDLTYKELYWDLRNTLDNFEDNNIIDFEEMNNGVEELLHGAEDCKDLIKNANLTDEEFYQKLLSFAFILEWSQDDRINVINMTKNNNQIIDVNPYDLDYEFFNKKGKYYLNTLKYIRKGITKKLLRELYKDHLDHTKNEIHYITTSNNLTKYDPAMYRIIEEYKKEFKKEGFDKRLKKL